MCALSSSGSFEMASPQMDSRGKSEKAPMPMTARTRRTRMQAMADLLDTGSGYDLTDISLIALVDHEIVLLVNQAVHFELVASNKDRPDHKYGTHADGSPMYAPEWYTAHGIATHIHEGLWGRISGVLSCEDRDEHGHWCAGSLLHDSQHWDGNGCNWLDDGTMLS